MYIKFATLLLLTSVIAHPSVKEIHNAYALHPVQINDFYAKSDEIPHPDSAPKPPGGTPDVNIEETVKEVQELIKSNPKLPRLTKGEIIDIIENITKTDSGALNPREEGKRALMVVMPFTAGSAQGDDIKELYTRSPVTHIIGRQPAVQKEAKRNRKRPTLPPLNSSKLENNDQQFELLPRHFQTSTVSPATFTKVSKYLISTTMISPIVKSDKKIPTTTTTTLSPTPTVQYSTQQPLIQFHPKPILKTFKPPIKYPNHRYPDDNLPSPNNSQGGIHIINAPQLSPVDDYKYSAPFTISLSQLQPSNEQPKPAQFSTSGGSVIDDIPIPENYRSVVKDLNLLIETDYIKNETPSYERVTVPKEEISTTLRSFGTSTKMPDISNVAENLSPDMKDLLMNFGLLDNPNKNATVEVIPSIETTYQHQNAEIKPESYLSFKPLPDSMPSRSEMGEFLARFGLGKSSFRSQKSITADKLNKEIGKTSEINMDVVPESMRHVMKNIGFVSNIEKIQTLNQISDRSKHTFNPSMQNATEGELEKLSKLLDMIKDLGKLNGSMTEENIKNIDLITLRELIGDFNGNKFVPLNERDAPNPLNFDNGSEKNGVKRQENVTSSTSSTTTEQATEKTDTDSPGLLDLEASFGNQPDVTLTTTTEPATTTPRTGFFYLLDWNTFLELDNQLGRRINLRFQPHAGDPSRFLPVTVP